MNKNLIIRPLESSDISIVTGWARKEGFAPGIGDVKVYRNTDNQGLWIGSIGDKPIGCIAGVKYNPFYGFLGLYIVKKEYRGRGYGICLWKHVLNSMSNTKCIGLEAAPDRIDDYSKWGFKTSSVTTRWKYETSVDYSFKNKYIKGLFLLDETEITKGVIQEYDATKEETPRPHFLSDWLFRKSGKLIAIVDRSEKCVGFGRIRPCLLQKGQGWRIGPLIANSPELAEILIKSLLLRHPGTVFIDTPGLNKNSKELMSRIGFKKDSYTVRMYKGIQPTISLDDVYGLACLELG